MMLFARRGPAAFRSLRLIPSVPACSPKTLRIPSLRPESQTIVFSTRSFTSFPRLFQEAAVPEEAQVDNNNEYTEFAQLAQHGIIHPIIANTINNHMNIHTMTEVQRMTLNSCLDGSDVIAQAKTGTGKTLAFLTPIVQRLLSNDASLADRADRYSRAPVDIRALIVSPTRELAEQIAVEASRLVKGTSIKVQTAVGGTQKSYHLKKMQREGCHLLIGTPGRIIDLLSDRYTGVTMDNIETFVLDEADRLLDIGFSRDIEEMQNLMPPRSERDRQTLMFSATVPKSVIGLVRSTMRPDFKFVRTVDPNEQQTHEKVPQHVVFLNGLPNQFPAILDIALQGIKAHQEDPETNMPFKAIVYFGATTQIDMAYKVFTNLRDPRSTDRYGDRGPLGACRVLRMNGGMTQDQRTRETEYFRRAESAILFSTDVTARGMDFPNVSHVIQMGLPRLPDDYIHRLGRTGRAGKPGQGWLLLNEDERRDFGRLFRHQGIQMQNKTLESASLDMSKPGQVSAATAQLLQTIEVGVKTVRYDDKAKVYRSLLGVMQQQFPGRGKQEQIDMMNDLARFGWGMETPPTLSRMLVNKLGFSGVRGIEFEEFEGGRNDRGGRGGRFGRDGGRDSDWDNDDRGSDRRGNGRHNDRDNRRSNDPFSSSGKGVFGGRGGGSSNGRRGPFGDS